MLKKFVLTAILGSIAYAGAVLTNNPAWNGTDTANSFGTGTGTPTYGETITVPIDGNDVLTNFVFQIESAPQHIPIVAYVQAWNGTETTGSPLFSSVPETTFTGTGFAGYNFNVLNLALTPGAQYILYVSTLGQSFGIGADTSFGATLTDTYSGGGFFFNNVDQSHTAGGSIADLNTNSWGNVGGIDLAFSATFIQGASSGAPEPSSIVLMITGLAALAWGRRRRSLH